MAIQVKVCRVEDVPPGEIRGFPVEGVDVPILVAHLGGQFLATTSMCPHEDVSLLGGSCSGTRIKCPGHAYEFDLATGACVRGPRQLELRCYRTEVIRGEVWVDLVSPT